MLLIIIIPISPTVNEQMDKPNMSNKQEKSTTIEGMICPVPLIHDHKIVLGHGSGGRMSHDLISRLFLPPFDNPVLRAGDAAKLMFERNIKKLPVVENGRLVGLVTLTDLLRSPGVVQFLNKLSLDGTSKHIARTVSLFFDPLQQHRRKCPLMMKDGYQPGCQDNKCMWWVGDECAVTRLSRQVSTERFPETTIAQERETQT